MCESLRGRNRHLWGPALHRHELERILLSEDGLRHMPSHVANAASHKQSWDWGRFGTGQWHGPCQAACTSVPRQRNKMPDAVTNIQDVQRPRKQGRRFGRRGGDSEGFHGRGHCRLGRRGSWTGEHSTQRTQAEQRLSRAWPGPAGESGVEGPACTQADGSRLALHRGPGAGQGARQGRNERPAEDPTEDCGGVQRRSEAARARGTGECTLAPGRARSAAPPTASLPTSCCVISWVSLPGQPLGSIAAEAGPRRSVGPQTRAGRVEAHPLRM